MTSRSLERFFGNNASLTRREEKEQEIREVKCENDELKSQKAECLNLLIEAKNEVNIINFNKDRLKVLESRDSDLMSLIKEGFEKEKKIAEKERITKEIDSVKVDIDKSSDKIEKFISEGINKSSLISFDFDLQNFLDTLSKEELLAFSGLLLNGLALNYVVSIIIVLYGDYLIKKFDLENKYPKIAKFIQLRRKLQNFYLKICPGK